MLPLHFIVFHKLVREKLYLVRFILLRTHSALDPSFEITFEVKLTFPKESDSQFESNIPPSNNKKKKVLI